MGWIHDLPHAGFIPEPKVMKAFNKVVFMSKYAEQIWRTYYNCIGKSVFIPNGVVKSLFYPRKKDLDHIIFFSHPCRGLKRLPLIFEAVKTRLKRKDLYCTAYSNAKGMYAEGEMGDHGVEYDIEYKCGVDGFFHRQPLPAHEIAREVGYAGLTVMPTGYPEICSNSILQSLTSGTPIVTTGNLGSAGEWVKHKKNGYLTHYGPSDYMVHTVEMMRGCIYALESTERHQKLIKAAERTKVLSWEEVGLKWEKMLKRL